MLSKGENASNLACKSCNTDLSISMHAHVLDVYVATVRFAYISYSEQAKAGNAMEISARIDLREWEDLSHLS